MVLLSESHHEGNSTSSVSQESGSGWRKDEAKPLVSVSALCSL